MGKENQIGDNANDINLATTRKQRADPALPLGKTPHQPLHTPKCVLIKRESSSCVREKEPAFQQKLVLERKHLEDKCLEKIFVVL